MKTGSSASWIPPAATLPLKWVSCYPPPAPPKLTDYPARIFPLDRFE